MNPFQIQQQIQAKPTVTTTQSSNPTTVVVSAQTRQDFVPIASSNPIVSASAQSKNSSLNGYDMFYVIGTFYFTVKPAGALSALMGYLETSTWFLASLVEGQSVLKFRLCETCTVYVLSLP